MKFLSDLKKKDLMGKVALVRVDLNIQSAELRKIYAELRRSNFRVSPRSVRVNPRLEEVLPTIKFLLKNGAKVVLLSHRGRPKGYQKEFSLKPFAKIFEKLLDQPVKFNDFTSPGLVNNNGNFTRPGLVKSERIVLLENLRFNPGEEKNNLKFAKALASLGDIFINDAFAVSHRANASVEAITKYLPSYAGLLLEKEVSNLNKVARGITQTKRGTTQKKGGLVIILGGAKISDKIGMIENFKNKADYFLIGGGIANNFLKAQGFPIGDSIYEADKVNYAKKLLNNKKIVLPLDYAVENKKILDIGPSTVRLYSNIIKKAKTIIWNGPMGYFEKPEFRYGSEGIVGAIIKSKAFVVVGGGETSSLFNGKRRMGNGKIFVSTGGGAMLEYLSGKKLPGIKALD